MKARLLLLVFLNVFLISGLFFVLNKIGIVDFRMGRAKAEHPTDVSADPFLMEKESLRKQWAVLTAKESDLEQRQNEFDKDSQTLQEKQKTLNTQIDEMNNQNSQKQKEALNTAKDEESIRSLSNKVVNVPPESGAAILNDMEPMIAVETIKMIDKIAAEKGLQSTSAYLISLMDPAKRKEVVRLLSAYPSNLGNLNAPPSTEDDDSAGAGEDNSGTTPQ